MCQAKAHKHKQLVKKYLASKARYLARKAKYEAALAAHDFQSTAVLSGTVDVSSDESEASETNHGPSCIETSQVPESPVRITPIKPIQHLLLSPNTCTKIANNKAAALARRAAIEAGRVLVYSKLKPKCAICADILSVQNSDSSDNLCTSCLQVLDGCKAASEPEGNSEVTVDLFTADFEGNSREVTVTGGVKKKEKKLKKAVASLKIDFEEEALKIKGEGSKKSRIKKTPKVFDV